MKSVNVVVDGEPWKSTWHESLKDAKKRVVELAEDGYVCVAHFEMPGCSVIVCKD